MISLRGSCRLIVGAIQSLRSCLVVIICFLQHPQINKKLHSVLKFYCSSLMSKCSNYMEQRAVDEGGDDRNSAEVARFNGSENTKPMSALMHPEDLLRVFNVFDRDFDGLISNEDIKRILNNLGLDISSEHILDVHGSSESLVFDEFLSVYNSLWNDDQDEQHVDGNSGLESHGEMMQVFKVFDRDGDGYICASELQQILESLGLSEGRDISVCENMIRKVDINFDGKVDFSEFMHMMLFE